ncbi:MAG: type II and III secretion system protein family protein, partial [Phycisphaerae bacterium]|nr:type II and III secretion system protein family protein [Phycisphaerae bacterium]
VAEQIVAMATPFSEKVLNFLEISGGQQVMLQVKFVEMSRRASQELGINLAASFSDGNFNAAFTGPNAGTKAGNSALSTLVGGFTCNSFALDFAISALKANNLARILAEPNVTVISGQEASLLAGGEFPVPVPQTGSGGGSTITIEYREFGVRLNVTPVVLGNGKIRLKVMPEVSDLDFSSPIVIENNNVPIILKRKVESTVEMTDGQTFAIGGLMRNSVLASRNATPLLGDLPVIGALFRSVRYQREETELVVLVTPSLVEPMNPAEVPVVPGEFWRHPNSAEFFLMGDFGTPEREARNPVDALPARFRGEYGFAPARRGASVRP